VQRNGESKQKTEKNIPFSSSSRQFIIILWIGLGAAALGLFNIFAAIGFFALTAFLIFFEIGKHGCVTCYYCKTCTIGMGKLPEFFFNQKEQPTSTKSPKDISICLPIVEFGSFRFCCFLNSSRIRLP